MTAAGRAFNGFKRKCGDFREELDTFSAQLDTVATEDVALQIIHSMKEEWVGLSTSYDELEDRYPEVPTEPQEDGDPVPSAREVLYNDLRRMYLDTKVKAMYKLADLRRQAVPVPVPVLQPIPAQVANRQKVKREEVVAELKRKIQILKDKADASVVSEYLAGSLELESLCAEVRSLWRSTQVMSEEIITINPTNLGEVGETQAATDTEVSIVVHPLELRIARLVTSCREVEKFLDDYSSKCE